MSESRATTFGLALGAASALLGATVAEAQSCASPQVAMIDTAYVSSTCGSNALPALNHGTIPTPGDDVVFGVPGGYGVFRARLYGDPGSLYVFVCGGCSANAQCSDAAVIDDDGNAMVDIPDDGNQHYVIVDGPMQGCEDFALTIYGPLVQSE